MNKILITDVETTGTDPGNDDIIECAGILYSVAHETIIASFSWLLYADDNPAFGINGIPAEAVREHGIKQEEALKRFRMWAERADAVVAHNARFDKSFLDPDDVVGKPWICTQDDIDWPRKASSGSLVATALALGLGISHAHRALTDCMTIARCFERSSELLMPTSVLLERAQRPKAMYAMVSPRFDKELNEKAKANGFRWEADRKLWCRRIAVEDVETLELPFEIRRLGE